MKVVDPHVHFWTLSTGNYPWLEHPVPNMMGDYSPMAKDFSPSHLRSLAAQAGIELIGVVNVEANPVNPLHETAWLVEQIDTGRMKGDVILPSAISVYVDLSQSDAEEQIRSQLAMSPRVRGVRQILNVHQNSFLDYAGHHYMRDKLWQQNLGLLEKYELLFELQLYPSQMHEAAQLAKCHPELLIVINHGGMYVDRDGPRGWREWRDGLRKLAKESNVIIKLSGYAMLDHEWTMNSIRPLVFEAIDAFGADRCMFASNFPVDGLYASYARVWEAYDHLLLEASSEERSKLFTDNAQHYYQIKEE